MAGMRKTAGSAARLRVVLAVGPVTSDGKMPAMNHSSRKA